MNYIADPRVGAVVAGGTTGTGLINTWLDWLPEDIGKLATVIGIILSLVLIAVQIRKMRQDSRAARLNDEKLRLEIDQMRWKNEQERKLAGARVDPA